MTLAELIKRFRFEANDLAEPYFVDEATLISLFNEAEREAALRGRLLRETANGLVVVPPAIPGGSGIAGETISALRAVWEDSDGHLYLLDAHDAAHIDLFAGVSLTAALLGESLLIQRFGTLDATGLNLVPGPVWLGLNGALTQSPPETGFDLYLGAAISASRLILDPAEAVEL
jgi:hypothetical protein